jgi:hypothetical protein
MVRYDDEHHVQSMMFYLLYVFSKINKTFFFNTFMLQTKIFISKRGDSHWVDNYLTRKS